MVRTSDTRMSGTAFGTIVLHVSPDAPSGGPLALVRSGDRIRLSVRERRIELLVEEAELGAAPRRAPAASAQTGRRLPQALRQPRDAGRRGLRLRFPARVGARLNVTGGAR